MGPLNLPFSLALELASFTRALNKVINPHELFLSRRIVKQWHSAVASARQKMQFVFAIISFEVFGHECKGKSPTLCVPQRMGHPECFKLLHGEYDQWYHQRIIFEKGKEPERMRHPAQ